MHPQVFNVPGRCFPVDVIHSQDDHMQDYAAAAVDTALQIHLQQPPGAQPNMLRIVLVPKPCSALVLASSKAGDVIILTARLKRLASRALHVRYVPLHALLAACADVPGDILIFLKGQAEIQDKAVQRLNKEVCNLR
jgi:HrpA-like RNA helicase